MANALLKHELYSIASDKRYIFSLALQLILIFAILPVFSNFLATGSVSITTPALREFIPLGVVDESINSFELRSALLENDKIDLMQLESYDIRSLEEGRVAAILLIPPDYDESLNRVLEIDLITNLGSLKADAVYDAVFPSLDKASQKLSESRKESFGVSIEDPLIVQKKYTREVVIEDGQSRFSSFFISYLIPLMLFFPIFTVGSIILDSVVGEREKKTMESILVSPVKRGEIVLSKFLSISFFVFLQLLLWISVFKLYGVPLQNPGIIILMILLVDSAIISSALLLSYYSRTVKEANILLMLLYTLVFITLIVSLSLNYFDTSLFSTPFTVISDLVAGGNPGVLIWSLILLSYTGLILSSNIKLIGRDDIVFGPRPSLETLLSDLSLWLFSHGKPGYFYLTFVFGIFAMLYATFIEVALGVFIIFTFGFTNLIVPFFALIEELIKPVGVYLLAGKRDLKKIEAVTLGVLSGIMFFALESAVLGLATYYLFPARLIAILKLRISTTLLIHAISSGIVGYGILNKDKFPYYLLLATLIHSVFNLIVIGGVR